MHVHVFVGITEDGLRVNESLLEAGHQMTSAQTSMRERSGRQNFRTELNSAQFRRGESKERISMGWGGWVGE